MRLIPRKAQREFDRGTDRHRIAAFLTRRQFGKTTNAARIALKKMMRIAGHTVVFGSLKLDLGREIIRKEAAIIQNTIASLADEVKDKALLDVFSGENSVLALKADDFAELYEAQRLEFRLYHSNSIYSRTKVVALTPDAVGETGDLILDEIGRVKNFIAVWEAVSPIISSNPEFRCILTTTPPPDDTHYSFELLAPPLEFDPPPNPSGNWYRSELGIPVLRVTAQDAEADGVHLYDDDTGAPITPEESRKRAQDKAAWDRNYAVKFVIGGTGAVSIPLLENAQRRGTIEEPCKFFQIEDDVDMDLAVKWIAEITTDGAVGIGFDIATTTKGTSNPSALAVIERRGNEYAARAILTWKTSDPDIATERIQLAINAVKERKEGGRARKLCIDATNERYYAASLRKKFLGQIIVGLVVASETMVRAAAQRPSKHDQSKKETINMKELLGEQLVGCLEDNHLALPPERYVREDFRLVKKERGQFVCEPDPAGRHGDSFDAVKLGVEAASGNRARTTVPDFDKLAAQAGLPGSGPWPPYSCDPPLTEQSSL